MKYIRQFGIILVISFIGELLNFIIPLPIPASIYGIILLFLCLEFKIIPLGAIKDTGNFLIEIMPIMFIPAAVGLVTSWDIIRHSLIQYLVVITASTVIVMATAGRITQALIRRDEVQKGGEK